MIKDLHPDFGPEISLDEAMEKIEIWKDAGNEHSFSFNQKGEAVIGVLSKILKTSENMIICKGDSCQLFFRFDDAKFAYGPMAMMEYPVRQESSVKGLHIFLPTGSYLFISSQAQLPSLETPSLKIP